MARRRKPGRSPSTARRWTSSSPDPADARVRSPCACRLVVRRGRACAAARPSTTAAPRAAAALAAAPKGPAPPAGSGRRRVPKAPSPTAAPTTAPSCASSDTIEAERKEHDSAEGEGQPQRRRGLLTTPRRRASRSSGSRPTRRSSERKQHRRAAPARGLQAATDCSVVSRRRIVRASHIRTAQVAPRTGPFGCARARVRPRRARTHTAHRGKMGGGKARARKRPGNRISAGEARGAVCGAKSACPSSVSAPRGGAIPARACARRAQ